MLGIGTNWIDIFGQYLKQAIVDLYQDRWYTQKVAGWIILYGV